MKMRACFAFPLVLIAGCATSLVDLENPGTVSLYAFSPVQFVAAQRIAEEVAMTCPDYRYNMQMATVLTDLRREAGINDRNVAGVDIETDVMRRSFQARHDVVVGQDNSCAAIRSEIANADVLGALFIENA